MILLDVIAASSIILLFVAEGMSRRRRTRSRGTYFSAMLWMPHEFHGLIRMPLPQPKENELEG